MKHILQAIPFFALTAACLCAAPVPTALPGEAPEAHLGPTQQAALLETQARLLMESNFKGAFASYHTDGIDGAMEAYRAILEIPAVPNAARISAWRGIANGHFERMEVDEANAALAKAAALPGLDAAERWSARKNQAEGFQRQLDFAQALALFEALWAEDLQVSKRQDVENRIIACLTGLGRQREVLSRLATWKRAPLDVARFQFNALEDVPAARKLAEGILADGSADFDARAGAVELLLLIRAKDGDTKGLMEEADQRLPKLIEENSRAWSIYRSMTRHAFTRFGLQANPDFSRWLAERILGSPNLPAAEFVKQQEVLFDDAVRRRDLAAACAVSEAVIAREDVGDDVRLPYALARAVVETGGDAGRIEARIERVLKDRGVGEDDPADRAAGLLQAARLALRMGDEKSARVLYAAREKMRLREPLRSIACTFIENGPSDITGFLDSATFKDVRNRGRLDRKYGDNLKFLLETDAALTGRKVTEETGDFKPTEFVATCDADGVKLFFVAPTSKAREIADGLSTLGGYELYLASGPDAPYHCYLLHQVPGEMADAFVTQYDNPGYRRARQKTGEVSVQHRVLEDGVATLLSFSWVSFFNQVPAEGSVWSFEVLHWEQGGYSWGGSRSVHNRSSFGSLVFANLTEQNRREIMRRLIPAAAAVYRRELHANNGYVEIWKDPELGDRRFYAESIKPLQEKLDASLARVQPGMTDAEVDQLFAEAVPLWMNIRYVVSDLRRDYLDRLRTSGL